MRNGKTVAYLGGNFDLMHPGHLKMFKLAKKIADYVVVSLNTDDFSLRYKKKLPLMSLRERIAMIKSCKYVDKVIVNVGGYDSKLAISKVRPDFIIHGDDWTGDAYLEQLGVTKEWLETKNIAVIYTPYQEFNGKAISTTILKERIKNEEIHTGSMPNSKE